MSLLKKIFLLLIFIFCVTFAKTVFADTPSISVSADPNSNNSVLINVSGDANTSVLLYYYSSNTSGPQLHYLGNTNSSGTFSSSLVLSDYNITQNSSVYVTVNGKQSISITWPFSNTSTNTNFSFSQASIVTKIGQSIVVTASNSGTSQIYLASNTSPQVANFSVNGNQITVNGLTSGQTTANFCLIATNISTTSCANIYAIVQNSSAQSLSFSQNNTSIITGQNIPITITGGNGFYQIQNNSNPSIISTNLNGPTLTLYANGTTGSTTIAICSTDMNACGTVNASIGTYTTSGSGLSFSTSYPTIVSGQTQIVNITGGFGNYYISSNSNTNIVQTFISTSSITLYGNTPGNATLVVCSPSGNCGTINATVIGSSGGTLTLSQNNTSLLIGQVLSVNISGGTTPYSLLQSNDGKAQYSLSGNTITINGVSSGISSATICSAGGACVTLNITISSNISTVSGVQPVFSQNNLSLNTNQSSSVYLSGNGGYYISNNSNSNIISASISGNSVVLLGISVGSSNMTVCQTGGQCNTLYVTVSNSTNSNINSTPITFDKTSVSIDVDGVANVNIFGGSGMGYYISYNSNSNSIGTYITGSSLIVTGKTNGVGTLSVCSSSNVCGSIAVTINQNIKNIVSSSNNYLFTKPLKLGSSGTEVTKLQEKLKTDGVYSGPITGYYGNLTVVAVKKFQKLHKLSQLGSVGPGTRAALNK